MNLRTLIVGGAGLALIGLVAVAALAYWVLGPTLAPSGQITAIPLATATSARPATSAATGAPSASATDPAVATAPDPTAVDPTATSQTGSGTVLLQISQAESEARFVLTEELRGSPTTVVGTTNQVAGEIAVDPADLSTVQVGPITVNARALATNETQRNRAIRNRILHTDQFEFITFTPVEIQGLQGSAAPGDSFTFQIVGDLMIQDVTQRVVFDVTATADAANRLSGTATTTVNRSDFGLVIPSVPFVANVSEEVRLELAFVAAAS